MTGSNRSSARITEFFGWKRNHYDRLVHFLFGFLIVIPSWRFARRILALNGWWSAAIAFSIIMAASAAYEVLEWFIAVTQSEITAESYNGQQGDVWDPQRDMALAGLGSILGLLLIALASAAKSVAFGSPFGLRGIARSGLLSTF